MWTGSWNIKNDTGKSKGKVVPLHSIKAHVGDHRYRPEIVVFLSHNATGRSQNLSQQQYRPHNFLTHFKHKKVLSLKTECRSKIQKTKCKDKI